MKKSRLKMSLEFEEDDMVTLIRRAMDRGGEGDVLHLKYRYAKYQLETLKRAHKALLNQKSSDKDIIDGYSTIDSHNTDLNNSRIDIANCMLKIAKKGTKYIEYAIITGQSMPDEPSLSGLRQLLVAAIKIIPDIDDVKKHLLYLKIKAHISLMEHMEHIKK